MTSISQALDIIAGQMPQADSPKVSSETGMISPVSGKAMRLVSRKWTGKVPK